MTKFLPYAIVLTLMMCLFAGQLSASAEGPVVIQKVMKDTVIYEKPSKTSNEMGNWRRDTLSQ